MRHRLNGPCSELLDGTWLLSLLCCCFFLNIIFIIIVVVFMSRVGGACVAAWAVLARR